MKIKYLLERIERYSITGEKEDFPACILCRRYIGTTSGCPECSAYNEHITDKLAADLKASHVCEQHQEHRAKLSRAAKHEMRKTDKRNRRDRTKIHWPLGWGAPRRAPRQHFICHHCGGNEANCGCL